MKKLFAVALCVAPISVVNAAPNTTKLSLVIRMILVLVNLSQAVQLMTSKTMKISISN
jgi:hypothetical protein